MYPRLNLKYENHTTGEHLIFKNGKDLEKKLNELKSDQEYKVKFKFENYKPNKKTIELKFKKTGFKIKTIAKQLIKQIEEESKRE